MGARCRGRVHPFTTTRTAKIKLRATVAADGVLLADGFTTGGAQGLFTVGAFIITQGDGAAAGRAIQQGCLFALAPWGFVIGGAAATGTIGFLGQQSGQAIATNGILAGRAKRFGRIVGGTTGVAGDDKNGLFAR